MKKKIAAAGLAAGLVAGTAAGFVLEMAGSAGASSRATVAAVEADATEGTTARPDHAARLQEVLQPLVDDGSLTQEQVDKVIAALEAARPGDGGRGHGGARLEAITTVLDMTVDEIRTAISNGQTLAQLAESQGKTGQDLIDALVAEMQAHLAEEVAAGEHTQEEADAKLAEATTRITEFVNNTPQLPREGMGGRGGGHHGGGHRGMPGDDTTDVAPVETTEG